VLRLDQRSVLPAFGVAVSGVLSMLLGRFLWHFDDEPIVDLGGDE
jgi:hypothetical protein